MTFENISPWRREVVVQKMVLFLRSCCSLKGWNKRWKTQGNPSFKWKFVWEKSKSLWAATFLLELLEGSCQEKQDHGNSGRNCGHIIGCASLLNGPICITHCHRRKGSDLSRLSTLIRSHSSQQRSSVGDSSLYEPQWYLMLKHAISISCCLKVALLTLFCITKPRKTLEEDLTHVQKTRTAQLSYSLAIYSYVFKISRPLRDVKFTINLAHGDKLIGRFYYILHGFSNKNLCPPPWISITQIHFW